MTPEEGSLICQSCGACCAHFRVLLNWTEIANFDPEGVPEDFTVPISDHVFLMAGTDVSPIRCRALTGTIGKQTCCTIYEKRGQQCRDFNPDMEDGTPNEGCDEARARHGLPPLPR
jgi:hypothetical protein